MRRKKGCGCGCFTLIVIIAVLYFLSQMGLELFGLSDIMDSVVQAFK